MTSASLGAVFNSRRYSVLVVAATVLQPSRPPAPSPAQAAGGVQWKHGPHQAEAVPQRPPQPSAPLTETQPRATRLTFHLFSHQQPLPSKRCLGSPGKLPSHLPDMPPSSDRMLNVPQRAFTRLISIQQRGRKTEKSIFRGVFL